MTQAFEILIRGKEIPVIVERNARRRTRIGFTFQPDGIVKVDSPKSVTLEEIKTLVIDHGRWVLNSLEKIATTEVRPLPTYNQGDLLSYLGETYLLQVETGARGKVRCEADRMVVATKTGAHVEVKTLMKRWYKNQAEALFETLIGEWEQNLPWLRNHLPNEAPSRKIRTDWRQKFMRSQWGSCSSTKRISLNSHLIKVPVDLIDYVVLHELCHLKHLNHSRRFYNLMDTFMPGWQRRRKRLNAYCSILAED